MKTLIISLVLATLIISCEKENDHKNLCPVISQEKVPVAVRNSFNLKYPHAIVDNWFYKDNVLYSASFIVDGRSNLATFNNEGSFIKEEIDIQQEENDQQDDDSGCKCEVAEQD